MSVALMATVRITIPVGDETVVLICRRPTAKEQSEFLSSRFRAKGRKVESYLYAAREALIDKILVDVEGATFETAEGDQAPLNGQTVLREADVAKWAPILGVAPAEIRGWKDLIPASWKSSAAMRFEDAAPEDEAGN